MWKRLPLRFRLFLPTIGLIAATGLFGIFSLQIFSPDQFENESEDAAALVRTVTKGLNEARAVATNPQAVPDGFAHGIGLARMQRGDYESTIPLLGPTEIRKSCEEANQLARKLKRLAQDNRHMLRKVVSLQDDERRELAMELHDELGPLLFAIRANAI